MLDWLDEVAGPGYSQAVLWTLLALLLLVVLLIVIKVVRSMTFGTFVAGGRNRKARLAVMDATAVDSHRRLVLVRRDDIEHLLLIGGPTDVVVERDIRIGQQRRPAGEPAREPHAAPPPVQQPAAPAVTPPKQAPEPLRGLPLSPAPRRIDPTAPAAARPPEPVMRPPSRPELLRPAAPAISTQARPEPRAEAAVPAASALKDQTPPPSDDLDDALLKELEVSLDDGPALGNAPTPALDKAPTPSLDDEMAKLLGELSKPRR